MHLGVSFLKKKNNLRSHQDHVVFLAQGSHLIKRTVPLDLKKKSGVFRQVMRKSRSATLWRPDNEGFGIPSVMRRDVLLAVVQ